MNRLPSPFASNMPTIMNSPNSSGNSSPGFLMLTRPPSASSEPHGTSSGMIRGKYQSSYSPQEYRPQRGHYRSPTGFIPFRNRGTYYNRSPHGGRTFNSSPYSRGPSPNNSSDQFQTPSPNTSFTNYRNSPSNQSHWQSKNSSPSNQSHWQSKNSSPSNQSHWQSRNSSPSDQSHWQSTPNSSSKNLFKQKQQFNKNTPLKSIPIEKFVSVNMVKDPWEGLSIKTQAQSYLNEEGASASESQSTESPSSDRASDNSDVDSDM